MEQKVKKFLTALLSVVLAVALLAALAVPVGAAGFKTPGLMEVITSSGWRLADYYIPAQDPFAIYYDAPQTVRLFSQWERPNNNPTGEYFVRPLTNIEVTLTMEEALTVGIAPGTFVWSVEDESIAQVEPGENEFEAVLVGTGVGETTLTVTDSGGGSYSLPLEVRPVVRVTPEAAQIAVGEKLQLSAEVLPADGPEPLFQWQAIDMLTMLGINEKTAAIWAEFDRKVAAGEVGDYSSAYAATAGEAAAAFSQGMQEALEAAQGIATVDENGLVTGVGDGHVLVIVGVDGASNAASAFCELTVGNPDPLPEQPPIGPEPPHEKPKYPIIDLRKVIVEAVVGVIKPSDDEQLRNWLTALLWPVPLVQATPMLVVQAAQAVEDAGQEPSKFDFIFTLGFWLDIGIAIFDLIGGLIGIGNWYEAPGQARSAYAQVARPKTASSGNEYGGMIYENYRLTNNGMTKGYSYTQPITGGPFSSFTPYIPGLTESGIHTHPYQVPGGNSAQFSDADKGWPGIAAGLKIYVVLPSGSIISYP